MSWKESLDGIANKAANDEAFKAKLLADPRATIEGELGHPIPGNLQVKLLENTAQTYHLVIPRAAKKATGGIDLEAVTGGAKPSAWRDAT